MVYRKRGGQAPRMQLPYKAPRMQLPYRAARKSAPAPAPADYTSSSPSPSPTSSEDEEQMSYAEEEFYYVAPAGTPDGFQFVLPYLDLLSRIKVAMVNKSFRKIMKNPLVWADLMVERSVCVKLSQEVLLQLVKRAGGRLKSLRLVDASWITQEALNKISKCNPGLERICVPECTNLNLDDFVSFVEAHSSRASKKGLPPMKQVHIGGFYNITPKHLFRLQKVLKVSRSQKDKSLSVGRQYYLRLHNALNACGLPPDEAPLVRHHYFQLQNSLKVWGSWLDEVSLVCCYYGNNHDHSEAIDKRPIDVEICPRCSRVRRVYDCLDCKHRTNEDSSNENEDLDAEEENYENVLSCRACTFCIPRCVECGTCNIEGVSGKQSLCGDLLCDGCLDALPRCEWCGRPACSRHEEAYLEPNGDKRECDECFEY